MHASQWASLLSEGSFGGGLGIGFGAGFAAGIGAGIGVGSGGGVQSTRERLRRQLMAAIDTGEIAVTESRDRP